MRVPKLFKGKKNGTVPPNDEEQGKLPAELFPVILRYLLDPISLSADDFLTTIPEEWYPHPHIRGALSVKSNQSHIVTASYVCKSWRKLANKILYAHPHLLTPRAVFLFAQTLKVHPHFQSLIKEIFIFDADLATPLPQTVGQAALRVVGLAQRPPLPYEILISIFNSASSMDTLYITQGFDRPCIMPLSDQYTNITGLHERLRVLVVSESFFLVVCQSSLPNLEVLHLSRISYQRTQNWAAQVFPRLRSLKISYSEIPSNPIQLHLHASTFPVLESLELHNNKGHMTVDEECIKRLKHLYFVGPFDCLYFPLGKKECPLLEGLQDIVMGCSSIGKETSYYYPYLPPHLKKLSLIVFTSKKVDSETGQLKLVAPTVLDMTRRFLLSDTNLPLLRELDFMMYDSMERKSDEIRLLIQDFQSICEDRGIELRFWNNGEHFCLTFIIVRFTHDGKRNGVVVLDTWRRVEDNQVPGLCT